MRYPCSKNIIEKKTNFQFSLLSFQRILNAWLYDLYHQIAHITGLDKSGVRTPGTTRKRCWATRFGGLVAQRTTKIDHFFSEIFPTYFPCMLLNQSYLYFHIQIYTLQNILVTVINPGQPHFRPGN